MNKSKLNEFQASPKCAADGGLQYQTILILLKFVSNFTTGFTTVVFEAANNNKFRTSRRW